MWPQPQLWTTASHHLAFRAVSLTSLLGALVPPQTARLSVRILFLFLYVFKADQVFFFFNSWTQTPCPTQCLEIGPPTGLTHLFQIRPPTLKLRQCIPKRSPSWCTSSFWISMAPSSSAPLSQVLPRLTPSASCATLHHALPISNHLPHVSLCAKICLSFIHHHPWHRDCQCPSLTNCHPVRNLRYSRSRSAGG